MELEAFHHVCYGMGEEGGGQLFWSYQIRDGHDVLYVPHDARVCGCDALRACDVLGVSLRVVPQLIGQPSPPGYFRDDGRLRRGEETRGRKKWLHLEAPTIVYGTSCT